MCLFIIYPFIITNIFIDLQVRLLFIDQSAYYLLEICSFTDDAAHTKQQGHLVLPPRIPSLKSHLLHFPFLYLDRQKVEVRMHS